MNAVIVCVDYADLLAVTLPYNRHHFDRVLVVTAHKDVVTRAVCREHDAETHVTNAFYRSGASFNKWLALEEGLDLFGRKDWLCIMDADVLWPNRLPAMCSACGHGNGMKYCPQVHGDPQGKDEHRWVRWQDGLTIGKLYAPLRRMRPELTACPEAEWGKYPIHKNVAEWAGYSQVFHCDDPVLGRPPWHQIDWKHAGGADSFFQMKWTPANKIRPAFEVLHLGEAGINWMGRADKDPSLRAKMLNMWQRRKIVGFKEERI